MTDDEFNAQLLIFIRKKLEKILKREESFPKHPQELLEEFYEDADKPTRH